MREGSSRIVGRSAAGGGGGVRRGGKALEEFPHFLVPLPYLPVDPVCLQKTATILCFPVDEW